MSNPFEALGLPAELVAVTQELGYEAPTAIQTAAIPPLLAGRDLIGRSKTGSGKTAAFGLPMLAQVDLNKRSLQGLVLCPTRELAGQVMRELRKLGRRHPGLVVAELIGGQPKRRQRELLERGVHLAVGTPGRLLDHLDHGALDPRGLRTVVLDEADRMLDMGFEEEVSSVLKHLPRTRQTALFSATMPERIEVLARQHQHNAVRVEGDEPSASGEAPTPHGAPDLPVGIRQLYVVPERGAELHALCAVLAKFPHESALVFCNFKASVAEVVALLSEAGLSVDRLDGDLDQFERDRVLVRFRNGSLRLLVATDVAGRGLDIEGLDLVVNLELPQDPSAYVHRIGRTGRAGRDGVAVSIARGAHGGTDRRLTDVEELTGQPIEALALDDPRPQGAVLRSLAREPRMATIQIAGGRRDKLRAGDLLGALTGEAGLEGDEVGRIDLRDKVTFVAVARQRAVAAAKALDQGRIKKRRFRATLLGRPAGSRGPAPGYRDPGGGPR
ncbi:MAG: DEAD/DEAH box helicase [Planctomycetota bacterium]|nr:DEAD/DEAH box helicase [Planctomycetota bacterium]